MKSNPSDVRSPNVVSQCLISFGSNLGNRDSLLAEAAKLISRSDVVRQSGDVKFATSRLFETPPIGGPGGQEPFLNAVASFETNASAHEVLGQLQSIEDRLGRKRHRRWDARSIDLDVVLHGQLMGGGSALIVPHPRYTARQFVLQPACDVAAEYRDPRFGWTIRNLAEHISAAVPSMAIVGGDLATRKAICQRLRSEHEVRVFAAAPLAPPMSVICNAPNLSRGDEPVQSTGQEIVDTEGKPWVAAYLPPLPNVSLQGAGPLPEATRSPTLPRLIVRMQRVVRRDQADTNRPFSQHVHLRGIHQGTPQSDPADRTWANTTWPAPHQIWPAGWRWPEYRLEIDDMDWAVGELASAIESMRCPVAAVTQDGQWW